VTGLPLRVLGALLLAASLLPAWSLLERPETGLAGAVTADAARSAWALAWQGLLIVALLGVIGGMLFSPGRVERAVGRAGRWLAAPSTRAFAIGVGVLAAVVVLVLQQWLLAGGLEFIDAVAQAVHARYLASGRTAGPTELALAGDTATAAFWQLQNMVSTSRGWVSHYPPGWVVALAAGYAVGASWLVAPLLAGVMAGAAVPLAERLIADRRIARAATLAVAVSPFLAALSAAGMNHVAAGAAGVVALWLAGRPATASRLLAGVAVGAAITTRPLTGLVFGVLALIAAGAPRRWWPVAAGATLPVAGLLAHNAWFFGGPTRFGYAVSLGPAAGLGFGADPWGNRYGVGEAVGYTMADLQMLAVQLLETPVSIVALVAAWLLSAPRLAAEHGLLLAWALLPVAANALYWHHGTWMGPRMLFEAAPAWLMLAALATVDLVRRAPARLARGSFSPRAAGATAAAAALLVSAVWLTPARLAAHAVEGRAEEVVAEARRAAPAGALVFVHGGWIDRLGMRMQALGMRGDSVEQALRGVPTCLLQAAVAAREAGAAAPLPEPRGRLATMEVGPGAEIRVAADEEVTRACAREAAADRLGGLGLGSLLARGALPGVDSDAPLFVRDLGPERNQDMLAVAGDRTPLMLVPGARPDELPRLMPYDRAVRLLWGAPTPDSPMRP